MTNRYTKEHEWARIEEDRIAICGISDYAQKALGDIVFIELPETGKSVRQGEQVAVVESAKAASEIYAPLDGEIVEINDTLSSDPGKLNQAALGDGWIFKMKVANTDQIATLMDEAGYQDYIKGLHS